ncbi:MAG TPA: cupin domain-containing protein [Chloroflexota bacterium]|nr:cupin domain-containing protein [Chloroflexota bacterium]
MSADDNQSRGRPVGETSGSPQRPPQRVSGPVSAFDLNEEITQLRNEDAWRQGNRNAKTLTKEQNLRVVLTVLRKDEQIKEHQTAGPVAIQAISGQIRLLLPDQTVDLPAGHLLVLGPGVAHDVEAVEDSAFLLTIGWAG